MGDGGWVMGDGWVRVENDNHGDGNDTDNHGDGDDNEAGGCSNCDGGDSKNGNDDDDDDR